MGESVVQYERLRRPLTDWDDWTFWYKITTWKFRDFIRLDNGPLGSLPLQRTGSVKEEIKSR